MNFRIETDGMLAGTKVVAILNDGSEKVLRDIEILTIDASKGIILVKPAGVNAFTTLIRFAAERLGIPPESPQTGGVTDMSVRKTVLSTGEAPPSAEGTNDGPFIVEPL